MRRKRGGPGILGTMAQTAVIAGTASVTMNAVNAKGAAKQQAAQQAAQQKAAAAQAAAEEAAATVGASLSGRPLPRSRIRIDSEKRSTVRAVARCSRRPTQCCTR